MMTICSTTENTIEYLRTNGLLKRKYICCGENCSEIRSRTLDGFEFKCQSCQKRYSLRTSSIFFDVRICLRYLLLLIYLFACNTSLILATKFFHNKVSIRFIGQWFDKLQLVMTNHLLRNPILLGGPDTIVEIDETCLGRKVKYHRGNPRGSGQKWIFGIIDRTSKKCHLEIVPNRTRDVLFQIIRQYIRPHTVVHSDEALVYSTLNAEGYEHYTVKHKETYVAPDGTHTNTIENFWSHLKGSFKEKCGVPNENLPAHLDEFIWRWNRKNEGCTFALILQDIAEQFEVE